MNVEKINRYLGLLFLVLIGALILSVRPAHAAYIDPNTGGMLFQILAVLIGALSGIVLIFSRRIKMMYYRISRYLSRSDDEDRNEDNGIAE